jgi:protein-disulfide isomerase
MGLRQNIETATTVILTLCAVGVAAPLVKREFFPAPSTRGLEPITKADWQKYAVSDMRLGPPRAAVTVTEFSDFECPACLRLYRRLEKIRQRHPNDVAIVYRNYPLDELHPAARPAALAAHCAATHGGFEKYYQYLFENQDSLTTANWSLIAHRIGITDTSSFARCLQAPAAAERLRADSLDAVTLGITGTPLVLINDRLYHGAPSQATLDSVIAGILAKQATAMR